MSYFDGASPSDSNSSWQVQRGRGCTAIPDSASDRTSVRSGGDDLSGASGVITPAQAYVRAVKTGQVVDRTLQYTIERSQPERRTQPHTSPSLPVTNPSPNADRRASFAQRLYASAVANRSLTNPSILSVERPIAAPAITASGPLRSIYEPQHRRESRSPTSPDSQREAAQTFNAADFYNSGVSRYGNPTRTEPGLRRPPSAVSDSRTSTAPIPAPHSPSPSAYALPSVSQLQSSLRRDIQPCDPAVTSWQIQTVPAQTINPVRPRLDHDSPDVFEPPIPLFLPPSASCEPPAPESSSLHTPTDGARSRRPSLFAQAPVVEPPPTSPPPFDVREASRSMVGPAITPAAPQSSLNLTHSEPVHAISPQEASHEVVPLYSLVDETQPPPSFDEIQPTVSTAVPSGPSSIARPGTPLSTAVRDGSSGDSSRAISSLASAGSNNQAMDVKVPAMFTDLDVGSAGSSASGSLTPSVPERTYMSPPMNPQQIVPSYDMRFPSSFSAQGAVRGPSRTPSALSSRSAHNNPTHDPLLSLGAYSNHPVDQARHASVLALAEMRSESDSPQIGVGLDRDSRTTYGPSARSADVADGVSDPNSLTHTMANLMGETTSRIASAARPEYEEAIVGENVSSEPRDGNVLHSSETSHFTDISAAPPPYSPGAEHDLQEARQCRSAERAAIGAQGTSSPYQSRTPAFHAAGAQQALVDTAIPARPRDEPRGVAAAAVGPSTRSELGRPQPTGFNMQKQYASRPLLLGTVTGDEGTFPSHQRQNLHPQARPSKGSPDMGNASCLPPPTRHAASYSKMQPPVTYGRDTTIYPQTGPMNSNELARRFAQEALSGSRGGISHPLHGGGQR